MGKTITKVVLTCAVCKTEFTLTPKKAEGRACCSRECAAVKRKQDVLDGKIKPWKSLPFDVVNGRPGLFKLSGVYQIKNIENGLVYIGSSKSLSKRLTEHYRRLVKSTHANANLQSDWNSYGEDKFEWSILEYIEDQSSLFEREQHWIDVANSFDRMYGYNEHHLAASSRGYKFRYGLHEKISNAHKGFKPAAKLSEDAVVQICKLIVNGESNVDISRQTGVPRSTVTNIRTGNSWRSVTHKHLPWVEYNVGNDVLNEEGVIDILSRLDNGESSNSVARCYNISPNKVLAIRRGELWTEIVLKYRHETSV